VKALAAQGSLSNVNNKLATSMERLSTGLRINSAKDDAAGLAITNRMTSDIRGFAVAIRNSNDGISMAQTAEGALGQVNDMLQRMRELAVQAANGSVNADNRKAIQLEVDQLKKEIDNIANRTNQNGIKLLDGSANKIDLQTGVNSGEMMTMKIDSVKTKDIGLGSRASLTSTASSSNDAVALAALKDGDLLINGVHVGPSLATSDVKSYKDNEMSAIAKAAAINAVSDKTGVRATVGETTVFGAKMTALAAGSEETATIKINGVETGAITAGADTNVTRGAVVTAINAISEQTGVTAVDTGDDIHGVKLVAKDGRNIVLEAGATAMSANDVFGLNDAGTYAGTFQLNSLTDSPITISSADTADSALEKSGLSRGTFQANIAQVVTNGRAIASGAPSDTTTGVLNGDTLKINGVTIGAAIASDDKASDVIATSSTKAASAIAIAAAINKSSNLTGVTAKAEANVITGQAFTAAAVTKVFINGVTIDAALTDKSTRADVASMFNRYTGQTGVSAKDNGIGITLTAEDGRNISLSSDATGDALGLSNSAVATYNDGTEAITTYANVSLSSAHQFTVESGSEGNKNFALLGFRAGTFGGADNGLKVDQIDVTTQEGASQALVALDEAIKSVSMNQASLGAFQNRLEAVVSNLTEVNQNMSASRSRIQDTDYATETTNLAKSQIIQQAATAMLAQANQSAQSVLSLLK